jgi:hypothetical protein
MILYAQKSKLSDVKYQLDFIVELQQTMLITLDFLC